MKEIYNNKLGFMYFEIVEDKFKLYDEYEKYIGYVEMASGRLTLEDIALLPLKLSEMYHITEIVDLGFCSNMMYGDSEKSVLRQLKWFAEENGYENFNEDELDIDINELGQYYFIVDYDEYL